MTIERIGPEKFPRWCIKGNGNFWTGSGWTYDRNRAMRYASKEAAKADLDVLGKVKLDRPTEGDHEK